MTHIKGNIEYVYSAAGVKLRTIHSDAPSPEIQTMAAKIESENNKTVKTTDYIGNKIYEGGELKRILVDGGYIEDNKYFYYLNDHLGNNRAVANASSGIIQQTQYYPFGSAFADKTETEQGLQPYKYNGKELDKMHGLNLYDYSARHYDAAIGRFTTIDPLAEKYYSISPYVYCLNNPMRYLDPNGLWVEDEDGNLVAEDGDNENTLAEYLNTSRDEALNMMIEQLLGIPSTNNDNDSEHKSEEGDIFHIGKDRYGHKVGGTGRKIQALAGSQFSQDLFWNYWNAKGDIKLRGKRFADILLYLKKEGVKPQIGKSGSMLVSFYDSTEYGPAFGRATIYYNKKGEIIGFYDEYDFDPKEWGVRSKDAEIKTRLVNIFSPSQAKSYKIRYGYKEK